MLLGVSFTGECMRVCRRSFATLNPFVALLTTKYVQTKDRNGQELIFLSNISAWIVRVKSGIKTFEFVFCIV